MATKVKVVVIPPKHLQNHLRLFLRSLSSTSSSSIAAAAAASPVKFPQSPTIQTPSLLDLTDHQKIFTSLPSNKLLHASLNLHMAAMAPMVDLGMWVMKSSVIDQPNNSIWRELILSAVRRTFHRHFCAGEDAAEAGECAKRVYDESGLRGMLAFSAEDAADNIGCDRNLDGFLTTVKSAVALPPSSVSFVVVKMTAICPLNLLEKASDLLRWQQKDPSFNIPWKHHLNLPIFSDSSPLYHTLHKPHHLTSQEEQELQLGMQRLMKLCQECHQANIPLVVDAEHTSVQPAIDYFTYLSAINFNKDDNPIVYGTMQSYLKDAKERLSLVVKAADEMGVPMGFKVVRGAYMQSERKLASSLGYESPIHDTIQETHNCYNHCASFMLEKIANGFHRHALILATHNMESGRLAATKARELGIGKRNEKLEFAQLYGMAEALSLGLRNAGFQVSKYMPYGPVEMVIPYLLRRAEENRGLLSATSLDRTLMRKELMRRLKAAIF